MTEIGVEGPHQSQPLERAGSSLEEATAAAVLVHGRGASARSILGMGQQVATDRLALLAPQAARSSWYPNPFTAPVETNEPGRASGLRAIAVAVERATAAGIPRDRVLLIGFSQGACLASEFLARYPARFGGLAALSGGLIGEKIDTDGYAGDVEHTPVFFGCSDTDPHIPAQRVRESAAVFERLNADVTQRLYEKLGHGVNDDELSVLQSMVADVV